MPDSTAAEAVRPSPAVPTARAGRRERTILVVDDSRAQRRILASSLERWGYRVLEAGGGTEALEVLSTHPVDIVLSDWMMPGIDGPELCRRFRALNRGSYGYFILLTSRSETEDVATGLDTGADDFLHKPVASDELRARVAAGARILDMARQLTEKNALLSTTVQRLRALHDAIDRDLWEARQLQKSLVPERSCDLGAATLALLVRPRGHVGGDLVGHFRVDAQTLGVYAIDVSGHGVASALMTARIASYLSGNSPSRNLALVQGADGGPRMRPPHEVCALLNETLLQEMETDLYFTLVLAEIDLGSGSVRLAQAGHPNPAILRADGEVEFLRCGGLPVGLIPGARYATQTCKLGSGDRLLLYSDGLTEAVGVEGRQLDEAGLTRIMQGARGLGGEAFLEAMVWSIERFAGPERLDDDLSAVLVEYRGT